MKHPNAYRPEQKNKFGCYLRQWVQIEGRRRRRGRLAQWTA